MVELLASKIACKVSSTEKVGADEIEQCLKVLFTFERAYFVLFMLLRIEPRALHMLF